jgi:hypothetical protein
VKRLVFLVTLLGLLGGCSSLLPKSKETAGDATNAWQSYQEAEQAFGAIVPGKTTVAELKTLRIDPRTNPNISILQRYEIMQLFMVNKTVTMADLDDGVRECLAAATGCTGWRVDQTATRKQRNGNAALDVLKMRRETHTAGWHFNGLLLIRDGVVLYKLTAGQPLIHQVAQSEDALGPLQAIGSKLNDINGIDVTDVRNGIKSATGGDSGHVEAVTALKIRR